MKQLTGFYLAEPSYDKIRKIITKKWPEVQVQNLDKDKNYEQFSRQSETIIAELDDVYRTFVLVHDWLLKTHSLLRLVLTDKTSIDFTTAPFSFVQIMTLLTNRPST